MEIGIKKVHGMNRNSLPKENETIADDFNLDMLIKSSKEITIYYREPIDCPLGRGNWIIDFLFKNDELLCLKYPKEMSEEDFTLFLKPLIDKLENKKNNLN
jgi:hypothetical protein